MSFASKRSTRQMLTAVAGAALLFAVVVSLPRPAGAANKPVDFRGHWTTGTFGNFTILTEDFTTGVLTGTTDFGPDYTLVNGLVTGNTYRFDIRCCTTYVSHNRGVIHGSTAAGHFDASDGLSSDYTATRIGTVATPAGAPASKASGPHKRSSFSSSVPTVRQVSTKAGNLVRTAVVGVVLLFLVVFPSELFNSTLSENYDEVRGWFGPIARAANGLSDAGRRIPDWLALVMFGAVGAIVAGFLDPRFGFDSASVALVIGVAASFVAVTVGFGIPQRVYMRSRHQDPGRLQVRPATLLIAIGCVIVSRVVGFQPGYLYGLLAGYAFTVELSSPERGRVTARAGLLVIGVSIAAWILWTPISGMANHAHPNIAVLTIDAFLSGIFVVGIESVVFGMMPLRFLEGEPLFAWNRLAWLGLYSAGIVVFVHVLLHPGVNRGTATSTKGAIVALVLFGLYGAISVAFWAYFRRRSGTTGPGAARLPATDEVGLSAPGRDT